MLRIFKLAVISLVLFIRIGNASIERKEYMPESLDMAKLKGQLVRHEGLKPYAYKDSLGYLTIGVGHLIDERKGGKISLDSVYFILDEDIKEKCNQLDDKLSWWRNLSDVRQRVLLDMAFNLGVEGLLKFQNTLAFIEHGQYKEASQEMLDSRWASQVGDRAKELAQMMETDT